MTLTTPPLRERHEDIIPLAQQFLTRSALSLRKQVRSLGESAQALLHRYCFPGNVRELSNLMERAVLFCPGDTLESVHFPSDVQDLPMQSVPDTHPVPSSSLEGSDPSQINLAFRLGESLPELEDRIINEGLRRADGNRPLLPSIWVSRDGSSIVGESRTRRKLKAGTRPRTGGFSTYIP